jgi:hypothetical protein
MLSPTRRRRRQAEESRQEYEAQRGERREAAWREGRDEKQRMLAERQRAQVRSDGALVMRSACAAQHAGGMAGNVWRSRSVLLVVSLIFHVWWAQEVLELEEVERHGAIIERHEFGRAVAGASPIDYGASVTPWNWSSTRGGGAHSPAAPDNIW